MYRIVSGLCKGIVYILTIKNQKKTTPNKTKKQKQKQKQNKNKQTNKQRKKKQKKKKKKRTTKLFLYDLLM